MILLKRTIALMALCMWTCQAVETTIDFGGRTGILLEVPPVMPTSMVLMLHGYTMMGAEYLDMAADRSILNSVGMLAVVPTGRREPGVLMNPYWAATMACCDFLGCSAEIPGSCDIDRDYLSSLVGGSVLNDFDNDEED